ncbi:hypothetical protein CSB93_6039 [Pseudomonas paraeruginosa]|uniref:Uncharacterized protein n=1 Tax=Pseudomonas paraeruginosa TaxID=2994495 RepID=A0A2R3IP71_9PSED|nr:hypothetical protein CSB93_6039 [Pseudomonas paraeruginosa]AWE92456.1 hypothetical protein CSC28_4839 [Pseudomonas paraeruginosa]
MQDHGFSMSCKLQASSCKRAAGLLLAACSLRLVAAVISFR